MSGLPLDLRAGRSSRRPSRRTTAQQRQVRLHPAGIPWNTPMQAECGVLVAEHPHSKVSHARMQSARVQCARSAEVGRVRSMQHLAHQAMLRRILTSHKIHECSCAGFHSESGSRSATRHPCKHHVATHITCARDHRHASARSRVVTVKACHRLAPSSPHPSYERIKT